MMDHLKKPAWKSKWLWRSLFVGAILLIFAMALSWVSNNFQEAKGWTSFLMVLILGTGILCFCGWLLRSEHPPRWLWGLFIAAFILRIGMGTFWFWAIPRWGHGTPAEEAGYIMSDAAKRDQAAWKLAQSNKPLSTAFFNNRMADQYGGILYVSALIYRYLGAEFHQPLLVVVIAAAFSSLAILFGWGLARRGWGDTPAKYTAWMLTLYPEAILLGSSQMREAFTVSLTAIVFYGFLRFHQERRTFDLAWILIPLLMYLPFSPPFAALLLGMLVLTAFIIRGKTAGQQAHHRRLWLVIGGLILFSLIGSVIALRQFAPADTSNPISVLSFWVRKSADLQAYISKNSSGWLEKVLKAAPDWLDLPILLGYGVVQPFLPASLLVSSLAPIWPWVNAWRSIGWTMLLALLVYALLRAWFFKGEQRFARAMSVIVWLGILVASFRGGGDMWDNPRYRATFAVLQVALAAWAWAEQRRLADPWFRRAVIGVSAVLVWFVPWYLRRYYPVYWPVVDLFKTLGVGAASAFLLGLWDWARQEEKFSVEETIQHETNR